MKQPALLVTSLAYQNIVKVGIFLEFELLNMYSNQNDASLIIFLNLINFCYYTIVPRQINMPSLSLCLSTTQYLFLDQQEALSFTMKHICETE